MATIQMAVVLLAVAAKRAALLSWFRVWSAFTKIPGKRARDSLRPTGSI